MTVHPMLIRKAASPEEQRWLDLYAEVADRLPGHEIPKARAWREAALDAFAIGGLPHRRVEEWKYTDLRVLMPEVRPLAGLVADARPEIDLERAMGRSLASLDAHRAVFIDGCFRADLSSIDKALGIVFAPLRQDLRNGARAVLRLPLAERDPIAALGTAFATDGALITVQPGAKLALPLHLVFAGAGSVPTLAAVANAVEIGEGAEVALIETYFGSPGQSLAQTQISLGPKAALRHVRFAAGAGSKQLASVSVELGPEANYDPVQLIIGPSLSRTQGVIRFSGAGARCHFSCAMMLRGREHGDITLVVDHAAEACESRELVKAVLAERGHGVFQGKVIVERVAQKTDGKQMANALLLSDEAEFDSKPELEIYADDVACGHGATAGQIDEDLLFYLRARGIPEPEARALLIAAFIGEALDKIADEPLREALREHVDAWLGRHDGKGTRP